MRIQITLTPSESKRLIAKGVKALPSVQKALKSNTIILAGGTTNAFLLEEFTGISIEKKSTYTLGMITEGRTGSSSTEGRIHPRVIRHGKPEPADRHWRDYLPELIAGDIFIKGGNALDHTGLAAVLAANDMGGTIGASWGPVIQRGIECIIPIGLEKLVPDVRAAAEFMAGHPVDEAIGDKVGLMPVMGATVVTEITALDALYQVKAMCIASGGVDGSEGAVVLVIDGNKGKLDRVMEELRALKGEASVR